MDKYYQAFKENVSSLEGLYASLSTAKDIRELNALERQAQQALFSLQHTSMGLAYWVQGAAAARRRAISNGLPDALASHEPAPVATEEPTKNTKSAPKKTKRAKKTSKKVVQKGE